MHVRMDNVTAMAWLIPVSMRNAKSEWEARLTLVQVYQELGTTDVLEG